MLSDEALEPIVESMRVIGFDPLMPILRYRGQILDGRNRFRAAALANVEPLFRDVPDSIDPYLESWKYNGERRDLNPGLRAAIVAKITLASAEWQSERNARAKAANASRAEKAKAQPRAGSVFGEKPAGEASDEARPADAGKTATALAAKAGVSRPTMERALRLAKQEPEKLDAVIRGERPPRKSPAPRIDREQRHADVRVLHDQGLGTSEIARRLDIGKALVSKAKVEMGIAETSAGAKLWGDVEHAAFTLEGMLLQIEWLTEQLGAEELKASEEEIRRCIKSLYTSTATVNRFRNALKRRLP
jgi:ParB-like chromosome segregation protein Spo0J